MSTKSESIKSYLYIALIIAVLVLTLSIASLVVAYSKRGDPSSFRSFSVSGEGKIVAIPDVAQFTMSVISQGGQEIVSTQKINTEKMNKAIEYLKAQEVKEKDIQTESYNVEPRYQNYSCPKRSYAPNEMVEPCPPPEIVGYTVRQTATVKLRDFNKAGDILAGVVKNGANSVSSLSFTIDDPTEIEEEARAKAISEAQNKAEKIAESADFRIGRLLSIDEYGGYIPRGKGGYGGGISFDMAEAEMPAPAIEPGSQEVIVNVTMRYEIE